MAASQEVTSTFHLLLLVLSLHGPVLAGDPEVGVCEPEQTAQGEHDAWSRTSASAKEVVSRVELDDRGVITTSIVDDEADPWTHALSPPVSGDAVATHSARGPPSA